MRTRKRAHPLTLPSGLALASLALVAVNCANERLDPTGSASQAGQFQASVSNVSATYDQATGRILVSWSAPAGDAACYRVYRTTSTDRNGDPDTSLFTRVQVPAQPTSYLDIPAPSISTYFYGIRAVRLDGGDTVEGELTPGWPDLVPCQVGVPLRLSINHGDVFATMPACSLYLEDTTAALSSVRFTDIARIDSIDAAGAWHAVPQEASVADPGDVYRQIAALVRGKFVKGAADSTVLIQNARRRAVPLFDTSDGRNSTTPHGLTGGGLYSFPWRLTMGSGRKTVYAEITYRTGCTDTLLDVIETKPHRVEMIVRNSPLPASSQSCGDYFTRDTTRSRRGPTGLTVISSIKIFYFPRVRFGVKTFNDTTINEGFDYWLISARDFEDIDPTSMMNDTTFRWYVTEPEAGVTSAANIDQEYEYSIDTLAQRGRAHLERIRRARKMRIDTTVLSASPKQNFDSLTSLRIAARDFSSVAQSTEGRKEFILISRFTEKFFGDTFISVLGYTDTAEDFSTYLDVYSPVAYFITAKKDPRYLDSNSVITQPFSFSLHDSSALTDGGFARITKVSLVIAKKPATLSVSSATARALLTPEGLLDLRHNSYDFYPATPTPQIISLGWSEINPVDWPAGKYIMAIVTQDEYGRTYFPNVSSESKLVNPWLVEVRTGG